MPRDARRYRVYVIQLNGRCRRCKSRRKPNGRCCLYVGSTGRSIEERLMAHLNPPSRLRATVVTQCGGRLRPDLYKRMVFRTRDEAEDAEASLAEYLRSLGYVVWGPELRRDR